LRKLIHFLAMVLTELGQLNDTPNKHIVYEFSAIMREPALLFDFTDLFLYCHLNHLRIFQLFCPTME